MPDRLEAALAEAQQRSLIGPGSLEQAIQHARGFALGLPWVPVKLLDLGSGGGLPGLPLAELWGESSVVLLDSSDRRAAFLQTTVQELNWSPRVRVRRARAEEAARDPDMRGSFDVVVARGFGRPAVTAECAAGFLCAGGWLLVSEPPDDAGVGAPEGVHEEYSTGGERWSAPGLAKLGMELGPKWSFPYRYQSIVQARACPARYPRRVGVPAKRPLF